MTEDTLDIPEPTERKCLRCGVIRPIKMFYIERERRSAARRGTTTHFVPCRVCQKEINETNIRPRRLITDAIKAERGCVDCGLVNPEHPEIFDFDHLPGAEKVRNIGLFMTKGTIEELMAEIEKCEVVCSNCHRIRTRARGSNYFGTDTGSRS